MANEVKMVTTVGGEVLPRTKCRKIRNKFYKVGKVSIQNSGDCFRVTDSNGVTRYKTLEAGTVVWDKTQRKYVHKSTLGGTKGLVGKDGKIGFFKEDINTVICRQSNGLRVKAINANIAHANNYRERLQDGVYYLANEFNNSFFTEKIGIPSSHKQNLPYGCDGIMGKAQLYYNKEFMMGPKNSFIEELYNANPALFDDYTFGLEFETTRGMVPDFICRRLGLMPLRDGSIPGIEYATIPLSGKQGLYTLSYIFSELEKRTDFDQTCSMHVHVGGMKRNRDNVLSLFKMMFMIQNNIYDLFPPFKKKNNGVKRQDYTAPLPSKVMYKMDHNNLNNDSSKDADMEKLIYFLSGNTEGYENLRLENVKEHPRNPTNSRKWNMVSRYLWFNLIPIVYTNKKTAEFRIFGMPTNELKLFTFLIMSLALVDFSMRNKIRILGKSEVVEDLGIYDVLRNTLYHPVIMDYVMTRFSHVRNLTLKKGYVFTERDIK